MPSDTTVTAGDAQELPQELKALMPSGTEIYNALMARIEPELLSKNIPSLDEKYKDESEEEKQQRLDRYNKAFTAYDAAYEQWISALRGAVKEERAGAYKVAEEKTHKEDEAVLDNLEAQFTNGITPSSSS